MIVKKYYCPLCRSPGKIFHSKEYQKCTGCLSIFRCPDYYLTAEQEKTRYKEHNNDIKDTGYQQFVSPIVNQVLENHTPSSRGLDFGAGTGPVISYLLEQTGFKINLYDPFFHKNTHLLEQKYDYIIACEVIEHFYHPEKEFGLLFQLLKANAKLYIMTDVYHDEIDFSSWYYKNDKTHVFFYTETALKYIQANWGFTKYTRKDRCIIFEK